MDETGAVMEAAAELGRKIAAHPASRKMDELVKQLESDVDAQRLAADLDRHREMLIEKERRGDPIEVEDKKKQQALQSSVAMHPVLSGLQMARMDVVDLMRKVDERIAAAGRSPG
ncbi:MAG: YlbF family regulator [Planctomycetota bacterium]